MKQKLLTGLFIVLLLLATPFMPELIVLIDIAGIEAAATFLALYFATTVQYVVTNIKLASRHIVETFHILTNSALLQPKNCLFHLGTTAIVLLFTGSTALACGIWVPIFAMSGMNVGV